MRHSIAREPWPGGGQHHLGFEVLADGVEAADAVQPGGGEYHGVEVAGLALDVRLGAVARQAGHPAQPGVDVAADVTDVQVGAGGPQLGGPPRGSGAHRGAGGQLGEPEPVAGAEHVPDVDALRRRRERQAQRGTGGQVLERMNGDVAGVLQQRVTQRGHEDAGAAHL